LGDDLGWKISNEQYHFLPAITWSKISSYAFGARVCDADYLFDAGGCCLFPDQQNFRILLGILCSKLTPLFMQATNPSVNIQVRNLGALQVPMQRLLLDAEGIDRFGGPRRSTCENRLGFLGDLLVIRVIVALNITVAYDLNRFFGSPD
jgi:hypothetical protein